MTVRKTYQNMILAAFFLALCMLLPMVTGSVPLIGNMLCPMHLPVLLCGLICGWPYGALVGFVAPLLRSVLFGMPPIFPTGIAMAFELCTYGLVAGLLFARVKHQDFAGVYMALIPAMLCGRVVWAVVRVILAGMSGSSFTWQMFLSGAFLTAIPGIILQLVFIPVLMVALGKAGALKMRA